MILFEWRDFKLQRDKSVNIDLSRRIFKYLKTVSLMLA